MFILYIIVGAIVFAAGIGVLYSIGWALKKMFPHSIFLDDMDEPALAVLSGLLALLAAGFVVMVTYLLGAGVIGLFTGGK